jgi:hypothetical protein
MSDAAGSVHWLEPQPAAQLAVALDAPRPTAALHDPPGLFQ